MTPRRTPLGRLGWLAATGLCSCFVDMGPGQFFQCKENSCDDGQRCVSSLCPNEIESLPWCVPNTCGQDSDCGPVSCIQGHCGCVSDSDCPGSTCDMNSGSCINEVCPGNAPDGGATDGGRTPDAGTRPDSGAWDAGCNNCWVTRSPMIVARTNAAGTVVNGRFYVVSGLMPTGTLGESEMYDPPTDTWTQLPSAPSGRCYGKAEAVGTTLYFLGGCPNCDCSSGSVKENDAFDTVASTWNRVADIPTPRMEPATASIGGKVYVAGGSSICTPCNPLSVLEVYDPVANAWTTKAPLPSPVLAAASVAFDGGFYVLGGLNGVATSNVYRYDPPSDTWSTESPLLDPVDEMGGAALDGVIYLLGGQDSSTNYVQQMWAYGGTPVVTPANPPFLSCMAVLAPLGGDVYAVAPPDGHTTSATLSVYIP